jgi:putative phosphoesterase
MKIAILSDTHVPAQADHIPGEFLERIREADHVIHTGDFGSKAVLGEIAERAADLTAVYGNADPDDIDLPAVASFTTDGTTFVVSHGMVNFVKRAVSSSEGVVFGREDWLDAVADTARARAGSDGTVVGIAGHSHEVENEFHDGVRVLNPGSATGVGPADGRATMMTMEVTGEEIGVTVHEKDTE